jgi:polar amino acid transport system substrate-binding protein
MSLAVSTVLLVAACTGSATPVPAATGEASDAASPGQVPSATPIPGGLLDKITKAGKIVISTDPKFPPQSELQPDGTYAGFDIDISEEIAKRLGVEVEYVTPEWTAITSGNWGGRWDISVGSMTITPERQKVLDFSPAYYYVQAQFAASEESGITTLEGLEGKTVCTSEGSTFSLWLNGDLDFGPENPLPAPPAGIVPTTLPNEGDCPETWRSGRFDFEGWLSTSKAVDLAISEGLPVVKVGEPAFYQPDAIAVDRSGPDDSDFMVWLKKTVEDMHADGTLSEFSERWYGKDITKKD